MPDRILLQDEFDLFTIHENLSQVLPNLSEFAVRTKKPRRDLKNYSFLWVLPSILIIYASACNPSEINYCIIIIKLT
jgi:hypothetical protein